MKRLSVGTGVQEDAISTQEDVAAAADAEQAAQASLDLGDMHAESGNFKKAVSAYRQAISASGDQDEAVRAYRKLFDCHIGRAGRDVFGRWIISAIGKCNYRRNIAHS